MAGEVQGRIIVDVANVNSKLWEKHIYGSCSNYYTSRDYISTHVYIV